MFRNRLYYRFKPLIPRQVRMAVRGQFARWKRRRVQDVWPILPGSEKKPDSWRGWPDGKQFGVVLTHDVEGPEGLANCEALAQIEKDLGFRSSFNFIPEGSYRVNGTLRGKLTNEGFEVGVHDLQHNGKLFQNRDDFRRKAERINDYLRSWGAVGFRSGFMLHNLEWLHDLNVTYDASTFDTDPFEPQPDGRHTIFPFWVPRGRCEEANGQQNGNRKSPWATGYMELPYTLPQDSTLFLLLKEKDPSIWIRKFDWIAERGGMVLVNVHPDYMNLSDGSGSPGNYPVSFYIDFLKHIRKHASDRFWHGVPRELARHCIGQNCRINGPGTLSSSVIPSSSDKVGLNQ